MAAAWLDEREPATLYLARGRLRPLWLGAHADGLSSRPLAARWRSPPPPCRRGSTSTRCARDGSSTSSPAGSCSERRFRPDRRYREDGRPPAGRAPREAVSCLERLATHSRQPAAAVASRRARPRRPPRAGARGRGTGTRSTRRAARRAVGTPAIRTGATGLSRRASAQSAIFGRRPSSARASAPCSIARSSRSSPCSTSNPASRSASPSEPNVCAYSDAEGTSCGGRRDRARSASSRAPRRASAAARGAPPA